MSDGNSKQSSGEQADDGPKKVLDNKRVLVVGLGRFGEAFARELKHQGIEVLAVDSDPDIVQRLSADLINVVEADATNAEALRQLGAEEFGRAVVAIANNIESSVLATLALIDGLKIPQVWAKALSEDHEKILKRIGVHRAIQPERDMGARAARSLVLAAADYVRIEDDYALVEIEVPESLVGVRLGDSGLRNTFGVTVVSVKPPGGPFSHADVDTVLVAGELILVAGHPADLKDLTDHYRS